MQGYGSPGRHQDDIRRKGRIIVSGVLMLRVRVKVRGRCTIHVIHSFGLLLSHRAKGMLATFSNFGSG